MKKKKMMANNYTRNPEIYMIYVFTISSTKKGTYPVKRIVGRTPACRCPNLTVVSATKMAKSTEENRSQGLKY